jgi:hypothetical protein
VDADNAKVDADARADADAKADASTNAQTLHDEKEETRHNVMEQRDIESGLKSGQITPEEASRLERGEEHIDAAEERDMKNGTLSPQEKAHIQAMQERESAAIKRDSTNSAHTNPDSLTDRRMQADVRRDIRQQTRIHKGVDSGALTAKETGKLEMDQARDARLQSRAAANGHIDTREQNAINHDESESSASIHHDKENGDDRTSVQ